MTTDGLESLVAPNCSQCLVPMNIAGSPGRPYWRCGQCGMTSVVGAVPMATASPQKRTDLGGIDRAWQGFEAAIEALDLSELHPQIRIGHALLWTNVLNDAFYRAGGGNYETARESHPGGRAVWGMVFAFNALKHGAALCYGIEKEHGGPGWTAGYWIWTKDADSLIETLRDDPRSGQVQAYRDHIAGRRLSEPFVLAARWFDQAASRWNELAAFVPDDGNISS